MLRGLTSSASGMLADERMQQLLTNNLANAQTPGFKASNGALLSFPQELIRMMGYTHENFNTGTPIGSISSGVDFQEGVPNFAEGPVQSTGRALDAAIVDKARPGTFADVTGPNNQVQAVNGTISAAPGGRLQIAGQPLAVLNSNGKPVQGMYAVKNPAYKGTALTAADGKPDYDKAGHPSYLFANAAGKIVGTPANAAYSGWAVRVGTSNNMGDHSFYAVAYSSNQGPKGIALTRDGHFQVNSQHQLTDTAGHPILPVGPNGRPIANGRIVMNPNYSGKTLFNSQGGPVTDANGQPSYQVLNTNGTPVQGHLGLVDANVNTLKPLGATEFQVGNSLNATTVLPQLAAGTGSIQPGSLEQSGVNPTQVMTQMIQLVNQDTANQKMIQAEDQMLNEAVSQIGKVKL
ncbi:flagellar basal body rod C-terminal domain-containing protein [Alicyclobacillus sp. SO9]|uniref:flagellar basal body rod C-terminal domain-containing protein n=1 Tax=Alicyclobacillus sp. SO9 TaxID=2665646 RepID=UPI0018E723BD|nr:flagellar basal body rod C-terminal domain-containing protein [Alicyclobacillus sp. SO9]QQE78754.1 flagellar basal body rod protein [Alicyclobacillus sp. SO9]